MSTTDRRSEDLDSFAAPLSNGPTPRWKRKALEANHSYTNMYSATSRLSARTTHAKQNGKRPKTPCGDRFIPRRSAMDMDLGRHVLTFDCGKENGKDASARSKESLVYGSCLASTLLDAPMPLFDANGNPCPFKGIDKKILAFSDKAPEPKEGYLNPNRVVYDQNYCGAAVRRNRFRHIPQQPEKILDAPALMEDFYLNLIDWGSNNTLAVALAETVYLWNADTGTIDQLCETSDYGDCITSVSWMPDSNNIAVGTNRNEVQIWDAEKSTCIRRMRSHTARVGALAWNGHLLSSGSRDATIHNHDVRSRQHHVATLVAHEQEVCGLKWSPNGRQLASGGNDNLVCVWENQNTGPRWTPKHRFDHHSAAVKALAWCPWQTNLLATGGGTADRHLRFWNTSSGACLNTVDTKSQVCAIVWSPHEKELVTSHGFSQNQLTVWKYPSLARMAELKGHTSRVLHMALSPDGQTVVSGAADETLRFWKVFAGADSGKEGGHSSRGGGRGQSTLKSLRQGSVIR